MAGHYTRPTLVLNIERQYFAEILALPRRKDIEWRAASTYWIGRLAKVGPAPFRVRLINGMRHPIPEATLVVTKVTRGNWHGHPQFKLHLGRVVEVKNWDRRAERPAR